MLPLKIALRYLFARKSHNVVNVIAIIAVTGIAVATAAIVVVLSVFNGFGDLAAAHLSRMDPQLEVSRRDGRAIDSGDSLATAIGAVRGVAAALPVISERALAVTPTAQTAVIFKGVPDNYGAVADLKSVVIDGQWATESDTGVPAAQISVGVANSLLAKPSAEVPMRLYVPRRSGRINPANPAGAFRMEETVISAVYRVDQPDLDADRITIPLDVARSLLDRENGASAIELALNPGVTPDDVRDDVAEAAGPKYVVRDRLQQRAEAFRMISVEKWITFLMLTFVLLIALFNIISTLSLLIIEKRDDMRTLRALGARRTTVRAVFTVESWLITLAGGIVGIILGVALSLAQQYGQFITLGGDPAMLTVDAYPVRVDAADLLAVLAALVVTGAITALVVRAMTRQRD